MSSCARVSQLRTASASRRARASAASSACARSPLAQNQTRIWAASRGARLRQAVADGLRRRRSSGAPTGRARRGRRRRWPSPRSSRSVARAASRCARAASKSPRPISRSARMHEQHVREVRGDAAERGGAERCRPRPTRRSRAAPRCWFATSTVLSIPYRRIDLEPRLPQSRRLPRPSQHRQHVGEDDVRSFQAEVIADLLGELQGLAKMAEALVGAAEVGEVAAEHGERPDLCLARADTPGRARAPARRSAATRRWRQASINPPASDRQRLRALRRGRLRRHELDRALERGERGVVAAGLVAGTRPRRTCRSAARCGSPSPTSSIARRASSTARGAAPTWLASSAAQEQSPARSSPASSAASGTAGHSASARSRCASASARPKTASAWRAASTDAASASGRATRRRPVRRELRRARRSAARELLGEPRVQLLALARAGSSRRSPPPAARGGSGSCPSPGRRRGRRARRPRAATRAGRRSGSSAAARSSG